MPGTFFLVTGHVGVDGDRICMVSLAMKRPVFYLISCSYEGTDDLGREDGGCFYSYKEKSSCATSKRAHCEVEKWPGFVQAEMQRPACVQ